MESGTASDSFKPPYNVVWTTFINFVDKADPATLPPRIDRSYLTTTAGGTKTYLIAALRSFELLGPDKEVTPALKELVKNPDGRPAMIADFLRRFYPEVVELGKNNATVGQLEEVFRTRYGLNGNTIRKATAFYMHAAQYAGIPLSVHWTVRKAGSGSRSGATNRPRPRPPKPTAQSHPAPRPPAGDTRSLTLTSGGTVTLAVSVNLFDLSTEDREFVLGLIDEMRNYDQEAGTQPPKEEVGSETPGSTPGDAGRVHTDGLTS
jgi:hypothetical protein